MILTYSLCILCDYLKISRQEIDVNPKYSSINFTNINEQERLKQVNYFLAQKPLFQAPNASFNPLTQIAQFLSINNI